MSNSLIYVILGVIVIVAVLLSRESNVKAKESETVPSSEKSQATTPKKEDPKVEVPKPEAPMPNPKKKAPAPESVEQSEPQNITTTQNETQMKNEEKQPFEMALRDMFAIRGRGLVVLGNVLSGTIKVADRVIISNGEKTVEDIVVGVEYDRAMHDSFTFDGEEKEIGLLLKTAARKDLKGDITGYSVRIAGEP